MQWTLLDGKQQAISVNSDQGSEVDAELNEDAKCGIVGRDVYFRWKKTIHSTYSQYSSAKCCPRGNQKMRLR
jgi:hypothetical protein